MYLFAKNSYEVIHVTLVDVALYAGPMHLQQDEIIDNAKLEIEYLLSS